MSSRIWGPVIVIAIFSLAGGLIGADVGLFPWDNPVALPIPISIGAIAGFFGGVLIVWAVRETEQLN